MKHCDSYCYFVLDDVDESQLELFYVKPEGLTMLGLKC